MWYVSHQSFLHLNYHTSFEKRWTFHVDGDGSNADNSNFKDWLFHGNGGGDDDDSLLHGNDAVSEDGDSTTAIHCYHGKYSNDGDDGNEKQ